MKNKLMLATNKTKLVCTIGPASESSDVLLHMLHAVARVTGCSSRTAWFRSMLPSIPTTGTCLPGSGWNANGCPGTWRC